MSRENYILVGLSQDHVDILQQNLGQPSLWIGTKNKNHANQIRYEDLENLHITVPLLPLDMHGKFKIFYQKMKIYFHIFLRCSMRKDVGEFGFSPSYYDYENRFLLWCQFYFYHIHSKNIHYVIFNIPAHSGMLVTLYYACEVLNLKRIIGLQSFFANRFMLLRDIKEIGTFKDVPLMYEISSLLTPLTKPLFYMKKTGTYFPYKEIIKLFLRYLILQPYYIPHQVEKNKFKALYGLRQFFYQRYYNKLSHSFTLPEKFVYFPLNLQPEMTTDILGIHEHGTDYANHIHVLEKLLHLLPPDIKILIKDNPKQTSYARSHVFFKYLHTHKKNIVLVPTSVDSHYLIAHSVAVISITGTVGFEAIQHRKPVLCFGMAWYRKLYGVFDAEILTDFQEVLQFCYDENILKQNINCFYNNLYEGVINDAYSAIVDNFDKKNNILLVSQAIIRFYHDKLNNE